MRRETFDGEINTLTEIWTVVDKRVELSVFPARIYTGGQVCKKRIVVVAAAEFIGQIARIYAHHNRAEAEVDDFAGELFAIPMP